VITLADLEKEKNRVVGRKQTLNAINQGKAEAVFLAEDTDEHIKQEIISASKENNVQIIEVESKLKLGRACGIDVSAACAALLK
jgi:large subunit ribosomal protein L7A